MIPENILNKLIKEVPSVIKLDLINDFLDLTEDHIVEVTLVDEDGVNFSVHYYGNSKTFNYLTTLSALKEFKSYLLPLLDKARKLYNQDMVTFKTVRESDVDSDQILLSELSKSKTEEDVAKTFDYNLDDFKDFMKKPIKSNLPEVIRAFLQDIVDDPFLLLWTK